MITLVRYCWPPEDAKELRLLQHCMLSCHRWSARVRPEVANRTTNVNIGGHDTAKSDDANHNNRHDMPRSSVWNCVKYIAGVAHNTSQRLKP